MTGGQPDAAVLLSLPELAAWLDPPMTARQLALLFRALRIGPDGQRAGKVGRPVNVYDAGMVMRLHAAVVPFLGAPPGLPPGQRVP